MSDFGAKRIWRLHCEISAMTKADVQLGGEHPQERHKGEPVERLIVVTAAVLAAVAFLTVVVVWNR